MTTWEQRKSADIGTLILALASPDACAARMALYRQMFTDEEWQRLEPQLRAAMLPMRHE